MQEIPGYKEVHNLDRFGRPAGGSTIADFLRIDWQDGPLGIGKDRKEPNGCFVETVIAAARGRLLFYESSEFACQENKEALDFLGSALQVLHSRTTKRETAGVEGTHGQIEEDLEISLAPEGEPATFREPIQPDSEGTGEPIPPPNPKHDTTTTIALGKKSPSKPKKKK